MMRKLLTGLVCPVAAMLAACSSHPQLQQLAVTSDALASSDAYDSYTLQSNEISLKLSGGSLTAGNTIVDAHNGVLFQVFRDDPWYRTTVLNIAKRSGTNTISKAGVSVIDQRQELLQALGGLAVTGIGVMKAAGAGDVQYATLPVAFRVDDVLGDLPAYTPSSSEPIPAGDRRAIPPDDTAWTPLAKGVDYQFGPIPHDAVALHQITALGRHTFSGLYLAACRDMRLRVTYLAEQSSGQESGQDNGGGNTGKTKKPGEQVQAVVQPKVAKTEYIVLKVADPDFVTRHPFPDKGGIATHDNTCGASTETTGGADSTGVDMFSAIAAQTQALIKALSAKSGGK